MTGEKKKVLEGYGGQCTGDFLYGFTKFVDEFRLLWFNLQEELLNGYKDLCQKIVKPKLKDYFKEIPKTPFE